MTFKDWLAARLKERDWGVAEAAGHIGVSHSMVSRYLNGKSRPERKTLRAIVQTFGISRDELEAMLDAERRGPARGLTGPPPVGIEERLADPRLPLGFYDLLVSWPEMTDEEQEDVLATFAHARRRSERRRLGGPNTDADGAGGGAP